MQKYNQVSDVPQDAPSRPVYSMDGLGVVITAANVLVSGVLIAAMYYDSRSATAAALSGVGYFTLSTSLTLLTLSGALAQIVTNGQEQKTLRQLHQLQHRAQPRVRLADPLPIGYTEPQQAPRLSNFVAPVADVDESAKREAYAWLIQLYQADGQPDPKKVLLSSEKERPGRIRIAAPSRPAKQYLLDRSILHDLGSGYRLHLGRCPNVNAARAQFDFAGGVPQSPTQAPHLPLPVAGGGEEGTP